VRLARNWKQPWEQSCWSPLAAHWEERDTMARIDWLADAPVPQVLGLRTADGAAAQYRLRLRNTTQRPLPVRVRIDSRPTDSQHAELDESDTLAPGTTRVFALDHPACMPEEMIYVSMHVTREGSDQVYFHREFEWSLARPEHAWDTLDGPDDPGARFRSSRTFHASFDVGIDADAAGGTPKGIAVGRPAGEVRFTEGLSGRALLSGRDCSAVAYSNPGNLRIERGTMSMWVRPVDWRGPGAGDSNHPFFLNGTPGQGYYGIQMARQVSPGPYLGYFMIQYPWRKTVAIFAEGEVPAWTSDQWHWVVLTWEPSRVTLYVDGIARGRMTVDPPFSERDLTSPVFRIGTATGIEQTAIDEVMVFDRCFSPSELREAQAFCRSSAPDGWEAVDFRFGYYPYSGRLKAEVNVSGLGGRDAIRHARLTLTQVGVNDPLAELEMPAFSGYASELIATLPTLEPGEYQLALHLAPSPAGLSGALVRGFTRQYFEWEHNDIGKSDVIVPPFTPLRIADRTVSTVLRDHTMSDQGLWAQVVSLGEPLLASPMTFSAWRAGSALELQEEGLAILEESPSRVSTRAAVTAGHTRIEVVSVMEVDGLMMCTVRLEGGALDRLELLVPLRNEMMPLGHFCGERSRSNFAGYVRSGEGVVWSSTETLKREILTPFAPYIWLGSEERGLCWFAETDRGWALDMRSPCQQIERQGDVLTLRIRLVQTPTRFDRVRTIRFGFQATPVKAMPTRPAHWRRWSTEKLPGAMRFLIAGSTSYAGHTYHDPFPYKRDLSVWQALAECRRSGKVDDDFVRRWVDSYPEELLRDGGRERFVRAIRAGQHMASRQPDRFLLYVQGRGVTFRTPEFQTFQDEWLYDDYSKRLWPAGYRDGLSYSSGPVPSWQDYNLWWLKKQMETVTDGLYFDCFYILPNRDRLMSDAYRLPDGRIQPGLPILDQREMMRRTAVMYREAERQPMIGPHMTNSAVMPILSFAQFALDWEWHYGRSDFQDRWSRDHIRAACTGRQAGCAPVVIGIGAKGGSAEEIEWLHRTFDGVVLTHELIPVWYTVNRYIPPDVRRQRVTSRSLYYAIRERLLDLGIGTDECRTYNYWQSDFPVTITGIEASSIVHCGKDEAMLIVTDYGDGGEARVMLDLDDLGLPADVQAVDFETETAVPVDGGVLVLPLKKHDFRCIVLSR
jgi:hypothetical protein